jgi:hypothetical protein
LSLRADAVHWFALGDTDDNMRYLQVRDWLNGQSWFDLRQYRMNPPEGANIHWSRIVDLPIAALMLLFRLVLSAPLADRWACAVAPLLPLLPLMWSLAFITRRLSREGSLAWVVAAFGPLGAPMGLGMYMPLRIDHHGWQLALVVAMLAGIVDRKWLRGGLVAGGGERAFGCHRHGDDGLSRRGGRPHRAALGVQGRRGAAHDALCSGPGRRHRAVVCRLRKQRQPQHRLRRDLA